MKTVAIVILLVIVVALLVKLRAVSRQTTRSVIRKAPTNSTPEGTTLQVGSSYQAVSFSYDANACSAVQAFGTRRFLVAAAPPIPLPDCTSSHCNCKYVHHPDRRVFDEDRRTPKSQRSKLYGNGGEQERRVKRDRRTTD
ncbi:MAG: hypothetical protein HOC23_17435 [Halieaceae bacterium]|jgi:hypothetical protein|nr:hypothetical protein [Halieaceae bacterium]